MNKKLIAFVDKLPGWLTVPEGTFLESVAKKTNSLDGTIVEIGSFCGKSTIWLAQAGSPIFSIDPHKGEVGVNEKYQPTYNAFKENIKTANVDNTITSIVKTSEKAAKGWKKKIKVLFIDALHDEKNALQDYNLWSKHVVDGGIIAIHDSHKRWCGSETVALKKIVLSPDFKRIGTVDSITYGIKGKSSFLESLQKLFTAFFIIASVFVNRLGIIITHGPEILAKHFGKITANFTVAASLISLI